MTKQNPLRRLTELGQSVWLDYIERSFVKEGALAQLIAEDGVSGLTSNPAIFQKAFAEDALYKDAIDALARAGLAAHEIHEALVIDDIRAAADVLAAVHARSEGREGFVSLEVSPHFAYDAEGTYWEAKRLWALVDRHNLMIKVPGTIEGVEAVRRLIADGVNVNITLLFSVERYAAVLDAFMAGLEERSIMAQPVERAASVASFFLSRIDTLIDRQLEGVSDPDAAALRGECAIACARAAYRQFQSTTAGGRWRALQARGARPQRLLWASTGTKNPLYSDVKYIEPLIAPDTVTTLPPQTLVAYRDHGSPALRLSEGGDETLSMAAISRRLAKVGIHWSEVASQLEAEGIKKFVEPHEAALAALRSRLAALNR